MVLSVLIEQKSLDLYLAIHSLDLLGSVYFNGNHVSFDSIPIINNS